MLAFRGQDYDSMYNNFICIIEFAHDDSYHGPKLKQLLKAIAKDGWCVK
jgi:hypothetical protein